ncbi:MAG TPA: hypothetical protein VF221_14815 [Chloroflexota bacterium]
MAHHPAGFALTVFLAVGALLGTSVPVAGAAASTRSSSSAQGGVSAAWGVQPSGTSQALFAVSCFDASRCKTVGAGGTVQYTKNGGITWRTQANPLAGSSTILYRIACVAPSTCYVIGRPNTVMVTHNGGATWSTHQIPLPGSNGELTDSACVSGQEGDLRGRLALCRLGLLDVACINARTCYVIGTLTISWGGVSGVLAPAMFLTTDGGSTWSRQNIPATAPCQEICGNQPAAQYRTPYPLEWVSCRPGPLCRAGGTLFLGSHEGYANLVIAVRKAGAPWTPVRSSTGAIANDNADSAACPTAARCYGVWTTNPFDLPGNGIWLSTNGGANWGRIGSGSPRMRNAIACPGPSTCYSVGNQGTITASTGGSPFVAQQSRTSHDLYGVTCTEVNACFAVGNKGTIVARRTM